MTSSYSAEIFSKELDAIKKESHRSPRPTFGAPTLMWHIGIWPKPEFDWLDAKIDIPLDDESQSSRVLYDEACNRDAENKKDFFKSINLVLGKLQRSPVNQFKGADVSLDLDDPPGWVESPNLEEGDPAKTLKKFPVVQENSLSFTLWWQRQNGAAAALATEPTSEALRVRVQVEAERDHITISFYLDAGKPWNEDRIFSAAHAKGELRQQIFNHIETVRQVCEDRARKRNPIEPLLPELDLGRDLPEARVRGSKLLAAADFLYESIWDDFLEDFGLDLKDLATERGQIFANFRTVVLSTSGLTDTAFDQEAAADAFPRFDKKTNECNAVLRGFWPFVRRMTPYADEKEHVACAVMGYRALYVTALNAFTNHIRGQESRDRLTDVPAGALPEMPNPDDPSGIISPKDERFENRPMRALLLTKGEPNTHQVGRIVERFNALGTMRFFALKSYPLVRDASNHIRICGERLDEIVGVWTKERNLIEAEFEPKKKRVEDSFGNASWDLSQEDKDLKNARMSSLANNIEKELLSIHADLDSVSKRVPGGLVFRVTRSIFYADKIKTIVRLLKIENIETWVTYEQFLQRSVLPTYEFIGRTGKRLEALRERLQVITQSIQTSSVYLQTLATRQNTEELRKLVKTQERLARIQYVTNVIFSLVGALFALLTADSFLQLFGYDLNALASSLVDFLKGVFRGEPQ